MRKTMIVCDLTGEEVENQDEIMNFSQNDVERGRMRTNEKAIDVKKDVVDQELSADTSDWDGVLVHIFNDRIVGYENYNGTSKHFPSQTERSFLETLTEL